MSVESTGGSTPTELPPLVEAWDRLDEREKSFAAATTEYASHPDIEHQQELRNQQSYLEGAFAEVVRRIAYKSDVTPQERASWLAMLFLGGDERRVAHLRQITPMAAYEIVEQDQDQLAKNYTEGLESADNPHQLCHEIVKDFCRCVEMDTQTFGQAVAEAHLHTPRRSFRSEMGPIAKNALIFTVGALREAMHELNDRYMQRQRR